MIETNKNVPSVLLTVTPLVSMEEMEKAGFYACICVTNRRVCISAVGIRTLDGEEYALQCKRSCGLVSPEAAWRCTRTMLVPAPYQELVQSN
jgi:hypothetical protein